MYSNLVVMPLGLICKTLITLLLTLPASAATRHSDADQPFKIKADAAVANELSGITIYTGNVTIDQGTLHIAADEIEVIMNQTEVLKIIARMNPDSQQLAHYEQQLEPEDDLIYADAKTITYFLREDQLRLAGQARMKQKNDLFEGDLLDYDMAKRIVELKSAGKERVAITLDPKPQ